MVNFYRSFSNEQLFAFKKELEERIIDGVKTVSEQNTVFDNGVLAGFKIILRELEIEIDRR